MTTELSCAMVRAVAAELALEVLDAEDRAAALAHIETCPDCRRQAAWLAVAADELLLLAPELEPSPGFEAAVVGKIAAAARAAQLTAPARRRPWRLVLLAAAAVCVAVAGLTLGLRGRGEEPDVSAPMEASNGMTVGEARIAGASGELHISMRDWAGLVTSYGADVDAPYWLLVERSDGTRETHRLSQSTGEWEVALGDPSRDVRRVAITDANGTLWCSASFAA